MIVPVSAGSGPDIIARTIGPKLYDAWKQPVVIDNRASAGGILGNSVVATATPDGYTLLLTSSGFAGSAALYAKLPYDPVRDFAGVTLIGSAHQVIVVAPSLNIKTLQEFIALARQKPKQLNFASGGIGSGMHYAAELFNATAGIAAVHVPYKGTSEALTDTSSGRTQYSFPPLIAALPLVKSGRLQLLAVTTAERVPQLPDVPTASEAGLAGFEYYGWYGLLAPAKTPRPIIAQLNKEFGRIVETAEMRERIAAMGGVPKSSTPEAFEKLIRDEIVTRRKVFTAAGVKPE
jgi:tripartite-type tricarboxylate transporter receptor subunit TctC